MPYTARDMRHFYCFNIPPPHPPARARLMKYGGEVCAYYHDDYFEQLDMKKTVRASKKRWREGVIVNFSTKGDNKADPGNCREKMLLSTVGKTFGKILNDRMGTMLE